MNPDLSPKEKIIVAMDTREWLANEIAHKTSMKEREVRDHLRTLVRRGVIESSQIGGADGIPAERAYRVVCSNARQAEALKALADAGQKWDAA